MAAIRHQRRSLENGAAFSAEDLVARGALTPTLSQREREFSEQAAGSTP